MQDYDAYLGIYSNTSELSERLKSKFQDKYLEVKIFNNIKKINISKLNYLIINMLDVRDLESVKDIVSKVQCKTIVLLPLNVNSNEKYVLDIFAYDLVGLNKNLGIILVPELLGYGVDFNPINISHNLIMQSLLSERVKISSDSFYINTISLSKLVDVVVRETFSFGVAGQSVALVGPRKGAKYFLKNFLGVSEENIIDTNLKSERSELFRSSSLKVDFSLRLAVSATRNVFLPQAEIDEISTKKINNVLVPNFIENKKKTNGINKLFKSLLKLIAVFLLFLLLPPILMIVSVFFLYLSSRNVFTNVSRAELFVNYSLKTVDVSQKISLNIPYYYDYSNVIYKTASLAKDAIELSKLGKSSLVMLTGKDTYDVSSTSDQISAILDKIYTDIDFLQSDINELEGFVGLRVKEIVSGFNVEVSILKKKISSLKILASRLSFLLGTDKPMKYLVLFQNNMELRPTGGFIGSFAIVTLDKGRLSDITVSDVYAADGQLKGHVDPPDPIRVHLGEGGWYLRDANWDPDFSESAKKVEWFLDKEINSQVDGVIAIDLSFIRNILKIIGPINLIDYGKVITADNLYTVTQEEVESNFFPGSIKKASFMSSLSKQFMTEIQSVDNNKYFSLLNEIYKSFETKHIQLYLHDLYSHEAVKELGYSGISNLSSECGMRCFDNKYSLIDANLGVNKSNLYISRLHELKVLPDRDFINNELLVTYLNSANPVVGNSGVYKNYARILIPPESTLIGVRSYDLDGSFEDLAYDKTDLSERQEIGFLIKVFPGEAKRIQIVWKIKTDKLANGGEFKLNIAKQAGTEKDDLTVKIDESSLSLTGRVPSVYTTTLERDFSLKLFLK